MTSVATSDGDPTRPSRLALSSALKALLAKNNSWLVRSISRHRLFKNEDEQFAVMCSEDCKRFKYSPTVAECQKAIGEVDKNVFLYKLSGDESVSKRDLEMYREDAIVWQRTWTKQKRRLSGSKSKVDSQEPLPKVDTQEPLPPSPIGHYKDVAMFSSLNGAAGSSDPMPLSPTLVIAKMFHPTLRKPQTVALDLSSEPSPLMQQAVPASATDAGSRQEQ